MIPQVYPVRLSQDGQQVEAHLTHSPGILKYSGSLPKAVLIGCHPVCVLIRQFLKGHALPRHLNIGASCFRGCRLLLNRWKSSWKFRFQSNQPSKSLGSWCRLTWDVTEWFPLTLIFSEESSLEVQRLPLWLCGIPNKVILYHFVDAAIVTLNSSVCTQSCTSLTGQVFATLPFALGHLEAYKVISPW